MVETLAQRCDRLEGENGELREQVSLLRAALLGGGDGLPIPGLTRIESEIVRLIAARDQGVSRTRIVDVIYDGHPGRDIPESNVVTTHVSKARAKLMKAGIVIETVWGWGWRMSPESRVALRALEGRTS